MKNHLSDPFGDAIYDSFVSNKNNQLIIHSDGFDKDTMSSSYFFRNYSEMPLLEQKALQLCKGKILDVGACSGSHSLWLQKKEMDVTALEISERCCQTMQKRGVKNIINNDIFQYNEEKFDTILLLMNGAGISGTLPRLPDLFIHLKKLLSKGGQILTDSSDLIYLYKDDTGFAMIDINTEKYYGEVQYQFEYNGIKGEPFHWLYVDFETLKKTVNDCGLKIRLLQKGEHYDYLVQIEKVEK